MHKTLFTIDGFDAIFEGYTNGRHWNGWACPYFTKEVAEQIVSIYNATNHECEMRYNAEKDCFETYTWDTEQDEAFYGTDINNLHLYPIGNMSWVWDDIADCQSKQSKKIMAYLQEEYFWLNCEQLYDVYYGIIREIDGYMTDEHIKIFADGFMAAYGRNKQ